MKDMNLMIIKKKRTFRIHKVVKLAKPIKYREEINCDITYQKIQKCWQDKTNMYNKKQA